MQIDAEQRLEVAVADIEAVDVEQLAHDAPVHSVSEVVAEIHRADFVRGHHLVGIALDQFAARVDRHHPIDDAQQRVDDVLDPHDRHASRRGSA